ncbi:ribonuclease T [Palleronia sediminis]|uniref:Ribonuclease T n=1 Tax=Palleronia sediminis TaxID=2547833 RepID=A0A4R5ZYI1_9RHOB|nr:ribonuclease T2 [Palleronia sediminis]TDL76260.1 ribonuclease T [Palleronia sediminis]
MLKRFLAALVVLPAAALAQDRAGAFDYWVLALSWSPAWCALEGEARGAAQCETDLGWSLHGLWPQHETGYPEYCESAARNPSRGDTAAMADIMGSGGLAWHQWNKHGRCSGMASGDYFALSRAAYETVARPEVFGRLTAAVRMPATVVEQAFIEANPALFPDAITVTCRAGHVQEVRICLTRDDLSPRRCGADVIRDCGLRNALFLPVS